jgi:hypothetical protein
VVACWLWVAWRSICCCCWLVCMNCCSICDCAAIDSVKTVLSSDTVVSRSVV